MNLALNSIIQYMDIPELAMELPGTSPLTTTSLMSASVAAHMTVN